jgi:hypothetical protein
LCLPGLWFAQHVSFADNGRDGPLNSTFGQRALQVFTEVVLSAHGGHGSLARERIVSEGSPIGFLREVRYTPVVRRCDTEDFRRRSSWNLVRPMYRVLSLKPGQVPKRSPAVAIGIKRGWTKPWAECDMRVQGFENMETARSLRLTTIRSYPARKITITKRKQLR